MILNTLVTIKINSTAKKYYAELLNRDVKVFEEVTIDIADLPKGSKAPVQAQCEMCLVIRDIKFRDYRALCPSCSRKRPAKWSYCVDCEVRITKGADRCSSCESSRRLKNK